MVDPFQISHARKEICSGHTCVRFLFYFHSFDIFSDDLLTYSEISRHFEQEPYSRLKGRVFLKMSATLSRRCFL